MGSLSKSRLKRKSEALTKKRLPVIIPETEEEIADVMEHAKVGVAWRAVMESHKNRFWLWYHRKRRTGGA